MLKNRVAKLEHIAGEVDIAKAIADARSGKTRPTPTAEIERLAALDRRYKAILDARRRAGIND